MPVLITTAKSPKALTVVRSLGKKGINITTGDTKKFSLSNLSKYSKRYVIYPSPVKSPNDFIKYIDSFLRKYKHEVLIPVHSEDTYLISKYKSKLQKNTLVPLQDYSIMMKVNDKSYVTKVANQLGIPTPETYHIKNIRSVYEIADNIQYPVVIKLRDSSSSKGVSYAFSESELITKYKDTIEKYQLHNSSYPIIQEYVQGEGYGVSTLFNKGDLRAIFTHRRIREYPISGGPSTYRISTTHKKMEDHAIQLLKFFSWHGVAMVEFKLESKTGIPYLLEVNPRFWGSINQAIESGVDFPYLLYRMAIDGDVKPVLKYKVGVKTKNSLIDYLSILSKIKVTHKLQGLKELFIVVPDDIFSWDDLTPILAFLKSGFNELLSIRNKI